MSYSKRSRTVATVIILFMMVLFAVTSNVVFASLGRISLDFQVSSELFSAAVAIQFAGFFVTSLLVGTLSDRFGKRVTIASACIVASVGAVGWMISPWLAPGVRCLLGTLGMDATPEAVALISVSLGAIALGAGGGVLESVGAAILTDLHPDKGKFYMNMSQVAYCIGAIMPTVVMAKLFPLGVSWKWFFAGTALLALILAFSCRFIRLPQNSQGRRGHGNWRSVLRVYPSVALPSISCFCYVFPEMATATFLGIYLNKYLHAPESMSLYCLPMFWSAVIVGRLGCAFLPQRQRYEYVIAMLFLAAAVFCGCQPLVSSWKVSMALFVLTGLAFAGTWPLIVSLASSRNLEDSGTAAGITISTGSLGCIFNPVIIGPLLHCNNIRGAFFLLAGLLFLGFMLMCLSAKTPVSPPVQPPVPRP